MPKINKFKFTYGLFGKNYRVAMLCTFYLTVYQKSSYQVFNQSSEKKLYNNSKLRAFTIISF